jgi:hypothetical protein
MSVSKWNAVLVCFTESVYLKAGVRLTDKTGHSLVLNSQLRDDRPGAGGVLFRPWSIDFVMLRVHLPALRSVRVAAIDKR